MNVSKTRVPRRPAGYRRGLRPWPTGYQGCPADRPEKGRTEIRLSIKNSARQRRPCPGPRISEQVGEHKIDRVRYKLAGILNRTFQQITQLPITDYAFRPD
ncbi:hypothetical protein ES707_10346 [subsurface metagenome]